MSSDVTAVYGKGPLWVTDLKAKLPVWIPPRATGADALPPVTLPALFHETTAKNPTKTAMSWRCQDGVEKVKGPRPAIELGSQHALTFAAKLPFAPPLEQAHRRSILTSRPR
jgi:hypothetical protein